MSEAVRVAKAELGPATQLVALYADGSDEAVVAAGKLTLEMIPETAEWFDGKGDPRAGEAAERVRVWWLNQVRIGADPEDAEELEERWAVAFEKARAKPAEPEPEAKPIKAGLPVVVLPPPPLQPPKPNWDEAVAVMNTQHAIIENVGGKTVIASWEPSPIDPGRLMVVFQNKESFLLRYSNRSVWFDVPNKRGGGSHSESVALGPWWLAHRDRLQFRGVTFRPGEPKVVR